MGYLLNILLRPELNEAAKHHKQRIHTLHLRTIEEWDATIEGNMEQANLHRFVYEIDLEAGAGDNLKGKLLKKQKSVTSLPMIRLHEKSTLIPYQPEKIDYEFIDIKDIQRTLTGYPYISTIQHADAAAIIPANNSFLYDEIQSGSASITGKYQTITISTEKPETGENIPSQNDARDIFFNTNQPGNKLTDLVDSDFNCWYRFVCVINGIFYFDYVLFTITPANRAWYVSLDFGSEASQYLLRNAHLQDTLKFPLVSGDYAKGLFIPMLQRLIKGNDTPSADNFLQYVPEEPTLYNSIFPVYYDPPIRKLTGTGEHQFWKPYEFHVNRLAAIPNSKMSPYITFLLGMQQGIDSAHHQKMLPNLKVLKQLINLRKIAADEETKNNFNNAVKEANRTVEFLAQRYGMQTNGITQYERLEEELINTYYREVLNTLLVAILSNLHREVIGAKQEVSLLNFGTVSLNIVMRILLPNMFGAGDIMQIQNWLRHDIKTYAKQVNEYIEKQGSHLNDLQRTNAQQLKETFALLNTVEVLFLPEGEAAAETLHGSLNESGKVQSPITDFMVVDIGKGTTDISIMKRSNNGMLSTQFRTGFAGAGNMMSYHCMKAILYELFVQLKTMVTDEVFTLAAYKNYLISLQGSEQYGKHIDLLALNYEDDRKDFTGDLSKFLYLVHPVVLEKLYTCFEQISAENLFVARVTDAIKKSIGRNHAKAIQIGLGDVVFQLGWAKELINPETLNDSWLDADRVRAFEKYMVNKQFVFADPNAQQIYMQGYHAISSTARFLVEPYLQQKLDNQTLHVFFTGRAANDSQLKLSLTDQLKNIGGKSSIKLAFPDIEPMLTKGTDVSQALKTVGIHGAATKAISLNYSANMSGQLMEIQGASKTKGLLNKLFNRGNILHKASRHHDSHLQATGSPDSFFMESANLSSTSSNLKKLSMNGYKCYTTQGLEDYEGKIYFTNYGFRLYEYHEGQSSQSIEANLATPLSDEIDGVSFLERLVDLSSKSLYPLCNGEDLFGFALQ